MSLTAQPISVALALIKGMEGGLELSYVCPGEIGDPHPLSLLVSGHELRQSVACYYCPLMFSVL